MNCCLVSRKAQQELETEGLKGEFDRTQATQTLETTLDKLLDHLEEKTIQEPEQQLEGVERASDPARGSRNLAPKQPGSTTSFPGCVLTTVCSVSTSVILTSHVLTVDVSEKPESVIFSVTFSNFCLFIYIFIYLLNFKRLSFTCCGHKWKVSCRKR